MLLKAYFSFIPIGPNRSPGCSGLWGAVEELILEDSNIVNELKEGVIDFADELEIFIEDECGPS